MTREAKIVLSQPVHAEVLSKLRRAGCVVMNPGPEPWRAQELHEHLRDADAWMAFMTDRLDADLLRAAPRLRTVACALKGYDNFDLRACAKAGVSVSFVPDLLTAPTAELAIGLSIAAARHVLEGDRRVRSGFAGWRPALYGTGLDGAVVAVLGLGAVGRAVVDRLSGFGCAELLSVDPSSSDPRTRSVTLHEALGLADYAILALPLLPSTLHLIDAAALQQARPGLVLVNVGRGSVVDESAVAHALQTGRLAAYAADVYEMEDWQRADRPNTVHPDLLNHPRTVLTPHLGSAVRAVRLAIEHRAADNLLASLQGRQPADLVPSLEGA